jgi:hypothetical protein
VTNLMDSVFRTGATSVYTFSHVIRREKYEKACEMAKDMPAQQPFKFSSPAMYAHVGKHFSTPRHAHSTGFPC